MELEERSEDSAAACVAKLQKRQPRLSASLFSSWQGPQRAQEGAVLGHDELIEVRGGLVVEVHHVHARRNAELQELHLGVPEVRG